MDKRIFIVLTIAGLVSACSKEDPYASFLIVGDEEAICNSYSDIIFRSSDVNGASYTEFDIDMDGNYDFGFSAEGESAHCWIGVDLYFVGYDNCKMLVKNTTPATCRPLALHLGDTIEYSNFSRCSRVSLYSKGINACGDAKSNDVQNNPSKFSNDSNDYIGIVFRKKEDVILCWVKLSPWYNSDVDIIKILEIGYRDFSL